MNLLGLTWLPEPRRVAIAVGAAIVLLGVLGAVDLLVPSLSLSTFSLDGERTVPAAFSAALLLGAGILAWQLSAAEGPHSLGSAGLLRFMGAFFAFMALDEVLAIHERVSASDTLGISWQVFYAPATLSAAIGWSVILHRLPSGSARRMWLGGAAAWFVSQVIEAVQWDGGRLVHAWTFVPEETLEMTGSLLWGLSLLLALRVVRERSEGVERGELQRVETTAEPLAQASRQPHGRRRGRVRGSDRAGQRSGTPTSRTPSSL